MRAARPARLAMARPALAAWLAAAGAILAAPSAVPAQAATPPVFGRVTVLPGSGGAEPSLAVDTSATASRNTIYVAAISPGANLWRSSNGGRTWTQPVGFDLNGPARGGDADVAVGSDGTVDVVDLNVSHSWVQTSTDHGATFNLGTASTPEADRPWITADGASTVYVAYHDFVGQDILVCKSIDKAATFLPCINAISPTAIAALSNCLSNTDIGKSLRVDPTDGSLSIVFSCSTNAEATKSPPYGPVHDYYFSRSTDGGITWTTTTMFTADTSGGKTPTLSNFWTSLAIDNAGNYYALMDGTFDDTNVAANPYHVDLLTSRDKGATWSRPVVVDNDAAAGGAGTHVLSDLVAGAAGQVDVVYYETDTTGEPNGVCGSTVSQSPCPNNSGLVPDTSKNPPPAAWRVWIAQSFNALSSSPAFSRVPVTAAATHFGRICTNGIVCGSSDRSLLDFISVATDCAGLAHVAFAGNPNEVGGQAPQVYEADQTAGSALTAPAACGPTGATAGGAGSSTGTAGSAGGTSPNTTPARPGMTVVGLAVLALAVGTALSRGRRRRR